MHICVNQCDTKLSRGYTLKCCRFFTEDIEAGHSKWRSRHRTDEIAFSYCSRGDKGFVPSICLHFGDIRLCFICFNHSFGRHDCLFLRNMEA